MLDVKVGRGAFMKDRDARAGSPRRWSGSASARCGDRGAADVDGRPLGRAAGNALEVSESVEVLRGGGPGDVRELTLALAREMLDLVGLDADPAAKLDDGSAYGVYRRMISAQGGDPDAEMPLAARRDVVVATRAGVVHAHRRAGRRRRRVATRRGPGPQGGPGERGGGGPHARARGRRRRSRPAALRAARRRRRRTSRAGRDAIHGAAHVGDGPVPGRAAAPGPRREGQATVR